MPLEHLFFISSLLLLSQAITYLPEDGIVSLEENTFKDTIAASRTAWIVEYFSHTCGHCISFAPTFIDFARNVKGWSTVVQVGAVTSEDRQWFLNNNVTRFPTLRFFLPWDLNNVLEMSGNTVDDLNAELLKMLQLSISTGKSLPTWPPLQYLQQLDELKVQANKTKNTFNFLVVEDEEAQKTHLGELVIMDHSVRLNNVSIHRSHKDIAFQYNMNTPALYLLTNQQFVRLPAVYNRTGLNAVICNITEIDLNSTNLFDFQLPYGSEELAVTDETYVYRPAHGLKMPDLLAGIRHTLWQEVAGASSISGDAMVALKYFLEFMAECLPVDQHVVNFLNTVLTGLKDKQGVSSLEWLRLLNESQSLQAYVPEGLNWKGCASSKEGLRGYPCSMWMMFHSLTVGAFNKKKASSDTKSGLNKLLIIRNYMEHFFSCEFCRVNFMRHTRHWVEELSNDQSIWSEKRAILELWKLHNVVNTRLHKDPITEDPMHPKIQFPALEDCERCRRKLPGFKSVFNIAYSDWNLQETFEFLLDYYSTAHATSCKERGKKLLMTAWSACSKTCGEGVSVRMSNNNTACEMRMTTRVCLDKVCALQPPLKSCNEARGLYKLATPISFRFLNCTSQSLYDWKLCGKCTNQQGRTLCCRPSNTSNRRVRMTCGGVRRSAVDEDGGVWLNRGRSKLRTMDVFMDVREINMCSCSQHLC